MCEQWTDKVALVTGGASGIGRCAALTFAGKGVKVVIADTSVEGGEETEGLITDAGSEAIFCRTDVTRSDEVKALMGRAIETFGRLDFAFNNAGIAPGPATTVECTEETWDRVININLKSVWLCMKYEIPQMLAQGGGAIVNMASVGGLVALQGNPAPSYVASKHGVVGLTKAAALEYSAAGVRVNAVCPAYIQTTMTEGAIAGDPEVAARIAALHPVGRIGTPEEVAEAVMWLCSDVSSFVTGHALAVDGGYIAQ